MPHANFQPRFRNNAQITNYQYLKNCAVYTPLPNCYIDNSAHLHKSFLSVFFWLYPAFRPCPTPRNFSVVKKADTDTIWQSVRPQFIHSRAMMREFLLVGCKRHTGASAPLLLPGPLRSWLKVEECCWQLLFATAPKIHLTAVSYCA